MEEKKKWKSDTYKGKQICWCPDKPVKSGYNKENGWGVWEGGD